MPSGANGLDLACMPYKARARSGCVDRPMSGRVPDEQFGPGRGKKRQVRAEALQRERFGTRGVLPRGSRNPEPRSTVASPSGSGISSRRWRVPVCVTEYASIEVGGMVRQALVSHCPERRKDARHARRRASLRPAPLRRSGTERAARPRDRASPRGCGELLQGEPCGRNPTDRAGFTVPRAARQRAAPRRNHVTTCHVAYRLRPIHFLAKIESKNGNKSGNVGCRKHKSTGRKPGRAKRSRPGLHFTTSRGTTV